MEIIAIEKKTYEQAKQRFEDFTRQVKNLCGENQGKEKWLGNDDVCGLLQISPRTLQDWRNTGKIPFVQIKGKILYKESEVLKWLEQSR